MNKKITYLFLALLLPVLIFLFLKYFGKNHFDIPVYYSDGVSDLPTECSIDSKGQYFIPDSILNMWKWRKGSSVIATFANEKEISELKELIDDEDFKPLQIVFLTDTVSNELKNCVLLMKEPWNTVLIDNQKRIRGYYKLGSREEMDRLEVELKILLNNY